MLKQKKAKFSLCKTPQEHSPQKIDLDALYLRLKNDYGPMGWWPVRGEAPDRGYHPGVFPVPVTRSGAFEVCMGAVLTQNTAWLQVEKALDGLFACQVRSPESLLALAVDELAGAIRPAGYRNQKSRYLRAMAEWFVLHYDHIAAGRDNLDVIRASLLDVRGIGPETADSILLYAFHLPTFVIDAYTRRICAALGIAEAKTPYATLREQFMDALPRDVLLYQEYHALLVQHAKLYYSGVRKDGAQCPIAEKWWVGGDSPT